MLDLKSKVLCRLVALRILKADIDRETNRDTHDL